MAENLKYNLKDELLAADKKLTGSLSLIGMTMLTQPSYINSMRSIMFTSHLKQFVNLNHPDFPGFFTNGENVVGKHSTAYKKVKHQTRVYRKVVKFEDITDTPFVYKLFVFDEKTKTFDVWDRKDAENLTEVFGFAYNNEVIDSLNEGDIIPKGEVVIKSKSYDEDMNYGYGKNVTMMYTTEPYTSEDACVVSESLAKEMTSIEINKVSIGINQNDFLLNLYGTPNHYKGLPDIGEYASGEVAVKRTLFNNQLLTDFKDNSLAKISDSDICYYKSGRVIDITIYCNNPNLNDNPFNAQIIKYLNSQTKYYQEIKDVCEEIMSSGHKYTHKLDYLYKRACAFLNMNTKWKDDTVFSNLLVEITIKHDIPLQIGQKLTGRYGNKSVIAQIRPDDEMPYYYDDTGKKVTVHLLFNVLAIINRTTAMPIFELSINFICNKVRAQMSKMKTRKQKEKLLFDIINDFNEEQAASMKDIYDNLDEDEKNKYIDSCVNDRIFIHQNPMWETKPIFFRLLDIYKKYDFLTPYNMFIDKWGRTIPLLNPSYVGEMYILKLKQTSRKGFSARSTGSINSKGLPERSYKNKSFTENRSSTPIRFGEFETLNFSIGILPEDIALFHLLYRSSPKGRRDLAKSLINGDDTTKIKIPEYYDSRVAEIFSVILKSLGLKLEFIDENEVVQEYDDDKLSIHILDGVEYFCTDYQFMLVERKKNIEKELLHKYGVIDKDELEKQVMVELMNRNFIIGPSKDEFDNTPAYCMLDTVEN